MSLMHLLNYSSIYLEVKKFIQDIFQVKKPVRSFLKVLAKVLEVLAEVLEEFFLKVLAKTEEVLENILIILAKVSEVFKGF